MLLRHLWYFGAAGESLKPGQSRHRLLLGEPILIGRDHAGRAFAFRDLCPHRGVFLSAGKVMRGASGATEVECPYHGWRFATDGHCAHIPSLTADQAMDVGRIRVASYPVREIQGNIWVYMGENRAPPEPAKREETAVIEEIPPAQAAAPNGELRVEPPMMPGIGDLTPRFRMSMIFPCDVDHAVIGLMDPAHGPFVHQSWWWRTGSSIHAKAKAFAPSPLGFTMRSHKPSKNSFAYKLLGGEVTTEIGFQLPGIRTELIRAGKHTVLGLTTVTPIEDDKTEVMQTFYWTNPILSALKPLLAPMAWTFLKQDRDIVELQREGLKHNPRLMLINDADIQAKWYFRLKKEWGDALAAGRTFHNPIQDVVLHWRS